MSGALAAMPATGPPGILPGGNISISDALQVSVSWSNAGVRTVTVGATPTTSNWVTPATAAVAAHYQIFFHVTSGSLSAGSSSAETWLDLTSDRNITKNSAGTVSGTYSIREKATGIVRVNAASFSLTDTA